MRTAAQARSVAVFVSAAYGVILHLAGIRIDESVERTLAYVPSAIGLLIIAFDLWIWKWPVVRLVVNHPRVDGTWSTTLVPHPKSRIPKGGNRGPIPAVVVIEQTFFTLHLTQYTAESTSHSCAAAFKRVGESTARGSLFVVFKNEPNQSEQPRSMAHLGSCELHISRLVPAAMKGKYCTNRFTAGDMQLVLFDRHRDYASFDEFVKARAAEKRASRHAANGGRK